MDTMTFHYGDGCGRLPARLSRRWPTRRNVKFSDHIREALYTENGDARKSLYETNTTSLATLGESLNSLFYKDYAKLVKNCSI
ncbi:MAG TPA: hypothetical protein ENK12_00850 [Gammaproteobacteria bacterium]|nr:hypothetical protein [Gammaproteobacteria bacterium]